MRTALCGLSFAVTACIAGDREHSQHLMNQIESQIQMPKGAESINKYARHYAFYDDRIVWGVYVLRSPEAPKGRDFGCEELVLEGNDLTSKEVPCPPEPTDEVGAGERKWFDDYRKLPVINDGGCMVVTVRFDVSAHKIESADCNGVA